MTSQILYFDPLFHRSHSYAVVTQKTNPSPPYLRYVIYAHTCRIQIRPSLRDIMSQSELTSCEPQHCLFLCLCFFNGIQIIFKSEERTSDT